MKAADTSVVVAAFAAWHGSHAAARQQLDSGLRLIEHCAIETYSVLTRLPAPHRAGGIIVRDFLRQRFTKPWLRLPAAQHRRFVLELPERAIVGSAVYDALIAATAAFLDAVLVSCDRRALPVYEHYGVPVALID